MTSTLRISRQQLAAFLKNDHDAIRQFETLFNTVANPDTTATATEPEIQIETAAHEALARIERLERALGLLELAPASHIHSISDVNGLESELDDGHILGTAYSSTTTYSSTNQIIPYDTSIPQIGEGIELLTVSYTPKKSDSILEIDALVYMSKTSSGGGGGTSAIFRDSGSDAIAAGMMTVATVNIIPVAVHAEVPANNTSETTFKLRVGVHNSGTLYINGGSSGYLGGVMHSYLKISELSSRA